MKNKRADLAIRLVEERARLRYSQADFADKAELSREGLRLYETGQRGMAAEFLANAAGLGVDVQYVLIGIRSRNLDEVEAATTPVPQVAVSGSAHANVVGIAQSGAVVHQIHTQRHVTRTIAEVKPGTEHITDEQATVLMELVKQIVEKEALLKQDPRSYRSVWAALNSHCGVTKYRLIKFADFELAKKYLDQWMGRLGSMASAPVKDGDAWRKRHYAYIKINSKSEDATKAVTAYIKKNFQAASLTDLSNDELDKTYRYVAGRKNK